MDPNQAQDKEVAAKDAKGGWIAAIAILLIAIVTIAGVIVGTNNELAKKDDEIANLKKAAEAPSAGQSGEPTTPAKTEPSLAGFDTKIVDAFKLLNGDNSYLAFEKMAVSKDGKYMFIIGKEKVTGSSGGLAQYYRSTSEDGTWKYYAGGNGFPSCDDFDSERIEIAKTYADELGLINVCTPDGTGSKKISEL